MPEEEPADQNANTFPDEEIPAIPPSADLSQGVGTPTANAPNESVIPDAASSDIPSGEGTPASPVDSDPIWPFFEAQSPRAEFIRDPLPIKSWQYPERKPLSPSGKLLQFPSIDPGILEYFAYDPGALKRPGGESLKMYESILGIFLTDKLLETWATTPPTSELRQAVQTGPLDDLDRRHLFLFISSLLSEQGDPTNAFQHAVRNIFATEKNYLTEFKLLRQGGMMKDKPKPDISTMPAGPGNEQKVAQHIILSVITSASRYADSEHPVTIPGVDEINLYLTPTGTIRTDQIEPFLNKYGPVINSHTLTHLLHALGVQSNNEAERFDGINHAKDYIQSHDIQGPLERQWASILKDIKLKYSSIEPEINATSSEPPPPPPTESEPSPP